MIHIDRPNNENYIILESLDHIKDNKNIKSIHVIKLDRINKGGNILFGRSNENDVRIDDISVSRSHAILMYDPLIGKVYLRDLKSKFGCLVLMKEDYEVKNKKARFQIGRTMIQCNIMEYKMNEICSIDGNAYNRTVDNYNGIDRYVCRKYDNFCFNQNIMLSHTTNNFYFNLWNSNDYDRDFEKEKNAIENFDL